MRGLNCKANSYRGKEIEQRTIIILYFIINKSPARLLLELRGLQWTLSTVSSLLRFISIYSSAAVNELITTPPYRRHRITFTNILLSFLLLAVYAWHCCLKASWDWCPLYCMLYARVMKASTCSRNLIFFKKNKNWGEIEKENKVEPRPKAKRHKRPLPQKPHRKPSILLKIQSNLKTSSQWHCSVNYTIYHYRFY